MLQETRRAGSVCRCFTLYLQALVSCKPRCFLCPCRKGTRRYVATVTDKVTVKQSQFSILVCLMQIPIRKFQDAHQFALRGGINLFWWQFLFCLGTWPQSAMTVSDKPLLCVALFETVYLTFVFASPCTSPSPHRASCTSSLSAQSQQRRHSMRCMAVSLQDEPSPAALSLTESTAATLVCKQRSNL